MRNKPFFCLCFLSLYFVLHHLKKTNRKRRWLSKNMLLANLLARALLTKKPEDSGYEIGYSALVTNGKKLFFFSSTHDRMWARCLSLISSIKTCYIILIQHLNHLCSEWGMSFFYLYLIPKTRMFSAANIHYFNFSTLKMLLVTKLFLGPVQWV